MRRERFSERRKAPLVGAGLIPPAVTTGRHAITHGANVSTPELSLAGRRTRETHRTGYCRQRSASPTEEQRSLGENRSVSCCGGAGGDKPRPYGRAEEPGPGQKRVVGVEGRGGG